MVKGSKKIENAWAMYDWANSSYNLVITSTIFPAYYVAVTSNKDPSQLSYVKFFGLEIIIYYLLKCGSEASEILCR